MKNRKPASPDDGFVDIRLLWIAYQALVAPYPPDCESVMKPKNMVSVKPGLLFCKILYSFKTYIGDKYFTQLVKNQIRIVNKVDVGMFNNLFV